MSRIANTAKFRAEWDGPETAREIGERYGCTPEVVAQAAKRFGYPKRTGDWYRQRAAHLRDCAAAEAARPRRAPPLDRQKVAELADRLRLRGLPGHLAPRLLRARTYADLSRIATDAGQAMQRLLPIWHEVRL